MRWPGSPVAAARRRVRSGAGRRAGFCRRGVRHRETPEKWYKKTSPPLAETPPRGIPLAVARSRTGGGSPSFLRHPRSPNRHATRRVYGSRWGTRAAHGVATPAPSRLYERMMAEAVSADTARPAARPGAAQPHTPEPEPRCTTRPIPAALRPDSPPRPLLAPRQTGRETRRSHTDAQTDPEHPTAGIARQHAANPATAPRQAAAIAYDDAIRLLALARQPRTCPLDQGMLPRRRRRRAPRPHAVLRADADEWMVMRVPQAAGE